MADDFEALEPSAQDMVRAVDHYLAGARRIKGNLKRLTEAQREQLLVLSVDHTATELSKKFGVSVPAVTALLHRRGLDASKAERLNEHAKRLIATGTANAGEVALAFGVSPATVYALRREHRLSQPGAVPAAERVGNKVTKVQLGTILDPALSAYEAAQATGLSVPTIYNYRRRFKDAPAATIEDLV